jgi:[citrate (pro-3S)-lyase] ligase
MTGYAGGRRDGDPRRRAGARSLQHMITPATRLYSDRDLAEARRLIESQNLLYEAGCDDVVGIHDDGRLVGVAARAGFVLKMFTIDPDYQGGPILGDLATELTRLGRAAGHDSFFVFTRPQSASAFAQLNFHILVAEGAVTLLEYGDGFGAWLAEHAGEVRPGRNGAAVVNGNPFTYGHLYLVETASRRVDTFYLFVVREDRSVFPFASRIRLAREATAHLGNVVVLDTSRYAVSAGTFPSYFLKQLDAVALAQMRVDLRLFASRIAPAFGIQVRFVGHEPYDATTAAYNKVMREVFPQHDLALVEIERMREVGETSPSGPPSRIGYISATKVRAALARRDFAALHWMVPASTLKYLRSPEGLAIADRLAAARPRDGASP